MFILIADDEKMIRLSLQSMLEELYPNEHMYIHASNGQAAIAPVSYTHLDVYKRQALLLIFGCNRQKLLLGSVSLLTLNESQPSSRRQGRRSAKASVAPVNIIRFLSRYQKEGNRFPHLGLSLIHIWKHHPDINGRSRGHRCQTWGHRPRHASGKRRPYDRTAEAECRR